MNKAVFWDRDGVINEVRLIDGKSHPPDCVEHLRLRFGIRQLMEKVSKMGYLNIVVTNQPDIARGKTTMEEVVKINNTIIDYLPIDDLYFCPHDNDDKCFCRKPQPGMLIMAQAKYDIDMNHSWMVGDMPTDMLVGGMMGCKTIFVDNEYKNLEVGYCKYKVKDIREIEEIIYNDY